MALETSPEGCGSCHAQHYAQWSSSMHAHASDDPLFVAMSRRAARDTGGAIGDFCLRCHAPTERGVTCAFCHSVSAVGGTDDDPLTLAGGGFRGPISDPVATAAHASLYSALHDRTVATSASLCGSCHDVTLPVGLEAETTYAEWRGSPFATDTSLATCGKCHMSGSAGQGAAPPNVVPTRIVHDHSVAAIDVPPGASTSPAQATLDPALSSTLCVSPGAATVTLTSVAVGHDFPSGAAHDRRAWVELVARAAGAIVFATGVAPPGGAPPDPNLWLFGATLRDAAKNPVLFLWQAASVTRATIPAQASVTRTYRIPISADDVTLRVRLAPVALEVTAALVASGDLDPSYPGQLPVYTLAGTVREWTAASGAACVGVP